MRLNLAILVIMIACMQVSASSVHAQNVTINVKDAPIRTVFETLRKQTGYQFFFDNDVIKKAGKVTLKLKVVTLKEALEQLFSEQPLSYEIVEKTIVVTERKSDIKENSRSFDRIDVRGKITGENNEPLVGATIRVKGTNNATSANTNGEFYLHNVEENASIEISFIGFLTREIRVKKDLGIIFLIQQNSALDQVQIIAYGSVSKRLNTGSVSTLTKEEISKQPVSNVLATLSGRLPGLEVTQTSGVPGSGFNLQIRGRNSIMQGSQPLILIDGIPFAAGNENINIASSAISDGTIGSGLSPFNNINPNDIESINILKDADATAIYGSRGANGVILITTRKGTTGKTQIIAGLNRGVTEKGKTMKLLNTQQYIDMRKEAFKNTGVSPDLTNAPDLLAWDNSRYTDLQDQLIGNTGQLTNANVSISGGTDAIQFLMGGGYYRETSVFPNAIPNQRGSMNVSLNHASVDKLFKITFSANYSSAENRSAGQDLTYFTFSSPNIPSFFDENGNLNWSEGGASFTNPYSYLKQEYKSSTSNLTSSINASYQLLPFLSLKALVGYNVLDGKEMQLLPKSSKSTVFEQASNSISANNHLASWDIEPQLEYIVPVLQGKLTALLGGTLHQKNSEFSYLDLGGFPSDALLQSHAAASAVNSKNSANTTYRYQAVFARLNYNLYNRYLFNATARRDGSSRFGSGRQYANFGAIGAAWLFSEEKSLDFLKKIISFGKLRSSFGVTGNDQIGDYKYLDAWSALPQPYEGNSALYPLSLANSAYGWEKNKKLEFGLDLAFFGDRVVFNISHYRNRSSNQLVNYSLPYQTGFGSILRNFPALIENKGYEFQVSGQIFKRKKFSWESSFNLSIPKNALLEFPGIESSSYFTTYVVGKSLTTINSLESLGVDPQTGSYHFKDLNSDGFLDTKDYSVHGNRDPKYFGGIKNTLSFNGISLDIFFDFRKQLGANYLASLYGSGFVPGTMTNQPLIVLDRWQRPGDVSQIEKFVDVSDFNAANVRSSNQFYSDQSFIRLKNIALSYSVPDKILKPINAKSARLYFEGQNLAIWNKDKDYDPEIQSLYRLPVLKIYTLGLQITY